MTWEEFKSALLENTRGTVCDRDRSLSWPELMEEAEAVAEILTTELKSDRRPVGILGNNNVSYLAALLGILCSGRIPAPLNTRLTAKERALLLRSIEASGFVDPAMLGRSNAQWFVRSPSGFSEKVDETEAADSILICSSGSEGGFKAASLSLDSMLRHAGAVNSHLKITENDCWLACLPFFHIGGLTIPLRCALAGARMTILEAAGPERINQVIDQENISIISLVATTLQRILELRKGVPFPSHLRAIITGGGPAPKKLIEQCPVVYPTYGLTEAGSMLTCARPGCDKNERFSGGPPLPETIVRVMDDNGKPCEPGEAGNILAAGPGLFRRYRNDPQKTALALNEGWLVTGDIGLLDATGCLHVLARRTDLIISGGENISPAEIEAILVQHPQVADAVVLPLAHPEWGQVPGAVVVCDPQKQPAPDAILDFLRQRLAAYKLPKEFRFVESLPSLSTGKLDYPALRKLFADQTTK